MPLLDFNKQIENDVKSVFLKEFSQLAIYKSNTTIKTISVHFFEEPLERLGKNYFHAWCSFLDLPFTKEGDTLNIDGTTYSIVESSHDEFKSGLNMFLTKV